MTEETTALTPQHLCTTKDLWRLRLDDDAIDDCKLLKVTYTLFSTEKAYILDAARSSRILKAKQKLGVTFISDKLGALILQNFQN